MRLRFSGIRGVPCVPPDIARRRVAQNRGLADPRRGGRIPGVIRAAIPAAHGLVLHLLVSVGPTGLAEVRYRLSALAREERHATIDIEMPAPTLFEDRGWRIEGRRGAARLLGLNPSTLRTRMMRLGVHKPQSFSKSAS